MRVWLVLLALMPALATAEAWKTVPVIGLDGQFGGDTLVTITYDDGSDQDINAGNGLVFYGGALVDLPVDKLQLRSVLGFKYSTSQASNIDLAKTAWPIEVGLRYTIGDGWFVEGGLAHHLAPKLTIDDDTTEFDSAPGLNLKVGWYFITAGYTQMTYEANGNDFDASSFNVGLDIPLDF